MVCAKPYQCVQKKSQGCTCRSGGTRSAGCSGYIGSTGALGACKVHWIHWEHWMHLEYWVHWVHRALQTILIIDLLVKCTKNLKI